MKIETKTIIESMADLKAVCRNERAVDDKKAHIGDAYLAIEFFDDGDGPGHVVIDGPGKELFELRGADFGSGIIAMKAALKLLGIPVQVRLVGRTVAESLGQPRRPYSEVRKELGLSPP